MGRKKIKERKIRKGNFFFTDYRMIHNLPPDLLIKSINLQEIFNNDFRNFKYEEGRKDEDWLFELQEITSTLK